MTRIQNIATTTHNRNKYLSVVLVVLMLFTLTPLKAQTAWETRNDGPYVKQMMVLQTYVSGNDLNRETRYTYDSTGVLKNATTRGFGGEQTTQYPLPDRYTHRYNNTTPLIDSAFSGSTLVSCTTTDFDHDITERHNYRHNGTISSSIYYIYSAPHRLSAAIEYSYADDGSVNGRKLYGYNKKGQLTHIQQYTPDEVMLMEENFSYNRRKQRTKRLQRFYEEGVEAHHNTEQYKYRYDKQGNWTECQYRYNGKNISTTDRTITYW